ncbi:MAG: hypothetical protein ACOYOL_07905 [Chthoniobacterales bacterium]
MSCLSLAQTVGAAPSSSGGESEFIARAAALARAGQWEEIMVLSQTPDRQVSDPIRGLARGQAMINLGQPAEGAAVVRESLARAGRAGSLLVLLKSADQMGAQAAARDALFRICREPDAAGAAFEAVRRRGGPVALIESAYERAKVAAPTAASVVDYARYRSLLMGSPPDEAASRQAVEAGAQSPLPRITLALTLLRLGRASAALAAMGPLTAQAAEMPPGSRAVMAAVWAANGNTSRAAALSARLSPTDLLPGESALLARAASPGSTNPPSR